MKKRTSDAASVIMRMPVHSSPKMRDYSCWLQMFEVLTGKGSYSTRDCWRRLCLKRLDWNGRSSWRCSGHLQNARPSCTARSELDWADSLARGCHQGGSQVKNLSSQGAEWLSLGFILGSSLKAVKLEKFLIKFAFWLRNQLINIIVSLN